MMDINDTALQVEAQILWTRLDTPGQDTCRLLRLDTGWQLEGLAVFREQHQPYSLYYIIECDSYFHSQQAEIIGYEGDQQIHYSIRRKGNDWFMNGEKQPESEGLIDLDLGFTPATNLLAIRRLQLEIGQEGESVAAYLNFPDKRLTSLSQTYRRLSAESYKYESPSTNYSHSLTVDSSGFVIHYPELWSGRM